MITVIGSLKGGSGKSTVTFNMAVWLRVNGATVVAIDADPQRTLSDVGEIRQEDGYTPAIEVVDGSWLEDTAHFGDYEHVLIDIGTASMDNVKKAISLADRILVPVPPSQADVWSTQRFLRFVRAVRKDALPEILGFINRADTHRAIRESDEAAAALVSLPDIRHLKPRLAQRTVYRRALSEGLAVFEQQPRSKAAEEWQALVGELYPDMVD